MNGLPFELNDALTVALVSPVRAARSLSGGQVGSSARVETDKGLFFVKWKLNAAPKFFEMEADGLQRLRENGPLRIPQVITYSDLPHTLTPIPYIVLEWIEPRPAPNPRLFAQRLGEGLAQIHSQAVSPFGGFGLEVDNFLGSQPQRNTPCDKWAEFYRDQRLVPQIERARREGGLSSQREGLVRRLLDRVGDLLEGHNPTPGLIHGDLWAGNLLESGEEPVLIDPAVYYADREVELAYMQLFSGFSPLTFAAYQEAYPLENGFEYRRPLHQLYPLLIHLNHFGETYWPQIQDVCHFYLD
jgi:fructosamine-3-kinase